MPERQFWAAARAAILAAALLAARAGPRPRLLAGRDFPSQAPGPGKDAPAIAAPATPSRLKAIRDLTQVALLTGPGSLDATDAAWGIYGTDLGHVFSVGDRLYMLFGDTYGKGFTPPPDDRSARFDWRSNAMAVIADRGPGEPVIQSPAAR